MEIIILTKDIRAGKRLRESLLTFDSNYANIPCLTKGNIYDKKEELKDCVTIFSTWYMPEFSKEEILKFFPSLKAIYYAAGTVKYFAVPFLENGIKVFSAASANSVPVAEFAASQIILANKGYFQAQKAVKGWLWRLGYRKGRGYSERKYGNYKATIGIIGCGAIGSKVVELLSSYNLNVSVYDPFLTDERVSELCVRKVSIEELFKSCDVISNHLPDIPETRGMIDSKLFSLMKPAATFINTGRGQQVNEHDLVQVLKKNQDMCALLDVTVNEPPLPWSPLYRCKNVFLTPHIAGSLSNEFNRMVECMVQAYHDTMAGIYNTCETTLEQIEKQSLH